MKEKNKTFLIWSAILIIVLAVAITYYWPKQNNPLDEATINCIAQNSSLYVSKTCPHCAEQKRILGDNLNLFNMTDCIDNQQACIDAGIEYVPTWVINGEKTTGVFELEELKEMTGC